MKRFVALCGLLVVAACSGGPPASGPPPVEGAPPEAAPAAPASPPEAAPAPEAKAAGAAPTAAAPEAKPAPSATAAPAEAAPAPEAKPAEAAPAPEAKPAAAAPAAPAAKAVEGPPPAEKPEAPAPAAQAAPKPAEGPAAAGDVWSQRLKQVTEKQTVEQQEHEHMAQRLYEQALTLKKEFKFQLARETAQRALRLDPNLVEARQLDMEMGRLLDQHPDTTKVISDFVRDQVKVRSQQVETEVDNHIDKGGRYLADGQFTEAAREFQAAEEKLKAIPYESLALKSRLPEVQTLIRQTQDEQAKAQLAIEAENRVKAIDEARKEEERRRKEVKQTIRDLLRKAIEMFEQQRYDTCAELCERMIYIDPHYKPAVDLRDHAYKARHKREYADYLTQRITEWKKVTDGDAEIMIPYAESLLFPDRYTWEKISRRLRSLAVGRAQVEEDPDILAIKSKLDNLKIELDFQEAGLQDIIDFIRTFSSLNIVIDTAVQSDSSVMDKKVTFKIRDLPLANVLKLLLAQYNLAYTFKEKTLFITTAGGAGGETVLSLHDVRDLLVKVSDNPGPTIELRPPSQQGQGLAGASFTLVEPKPAGVNEEQIETLIKDNVQPGTWEAGDHSITLTPNQQLLVNHTVAAQREVRDFLGKLRQYAGSMVSIEARFVAAHDNFLEDVGLDLKGLQDLEPGGPSGAPAAISVGPSARTPPTVVDFNDLTGNNRPGFISNEFNPRGPEDLDLRFRSIGSFLGNTSASGGVLIPEGGRPGYNLVNRLSNRGGLGLQYFLLGEQELNMVLRAVKKSEKAVLVSAPQITVFNTQRSNVFIATQQAYVQDLDVQTTTFAFALDPIIGYVQDGIVLDVRPIISNDRRYVTMEMRTTFAKLRDLRTLDNISGIAGARIQLPFMELEKAATTVRIPDRGSLLISGFRDILSRDLYSTVPILGDIPIINFFFSRKGKGIEKRKLFIFVTPEIIDLGEHQAEQVEPPQ